MQIVLTLLGPKPCPLCLLNVSPFRYAFSFLSFDLRFKVLYAYKPVGLENLIFIAGEGRRPFNLSVAY